MSLHRSGFVIARYASKKIEKTSGGYWHRLRRVAGGEVYPTHVIYLDNSERRFWLSNNTTGKQHFPLLYVMLRHEPCSNDESKSPAKPPKEQGEIFLRGI